MFGIHFHFVFSETTNAVFESVNSTYQIINSKTQWDHARAYCHSIDGHLAAFESAEEYSSISAHMPDETLHFGLTVLKQNHEFAWEHTGQAIGAYRNWAPDKPTRRSHELCGFFNRRGWYDVKCTYKFRFLCEFPKQ